MDSLELCNNHTSTVNHTTQFIFVGNYVNVMINPCKNRQTIR